MRTLGIVQINQTIAATNRPPTLATAIIAESLPVGSIREE